MEGGGRVEILEKELVAVKSEVDQMNNIREKINNILDRESQIEDKLVSDLRASGKDHSTRERVPSGSPPKVSGPPAPPPPPPKVSGPLASRPPPKPPTAPPPPPPTKISGKPDTSSESGDIFDQIRAGATLKKTKKQPTPKKAARSDLLAGLRKGQQNLQKSKKKLAPRPAAPPDLMAQIQGASKASLKSAKDRGQKKVEKTKEQKVSDQIRGAFAQHRTMIAGDDDEEEDPNADGDDNDWDPAEDDPQDQFTPSYKVSGLSAPHVPASASN